MLTSPDRRRLYSCISIQSGFVQGDSTTYQLLHTYHTFCEAVDSGKEVRAVFCDISKALESGIKDYFISYGEYDALKKI